MRMSNEWNWQPFVEPGSVCCSLVRKGVILLWHCFSSASDNGFVG